MLPGMVTKPRVAIVGAGNLGTALGLALRVAGYEIEAVVARSRGASLKEARKLAKQVGARAVVDLSGVRAKLIWFCVPDAAIAEAGGLLADKVEWKGRVALHSSGALTSDELGVLRRRGASVASVHPMMTFVRGAYLAESKSSRSQPGLAGVPFALEGDPAAVRVVRRVVRDLGGRAYAILKKDKAAYHAWGTFASPLFTALLATTERVAMLAGVNRKDAKRRILPILRQTLENYATLGATGGFSGPIVRGDVDTVKGHLRALRGAGVAREVYAALARSALQYLPAQNKKLLKQLLESQPD
jgi:predicted short-subunit dehydrogenase-like oxidoreductase (DUF2520 family)